MVHGTAMFAQQRCNTCQGEEVFIVTNYTHENLPMCRLHTMCTTSQCQVFKDLTSLRKESTVQRNEAMFVYCYVWMMLWLCKQCKTPTYTFLARHAEFHIIHTWRKIMWLTAWIIEPSLLFIEMSCLFGKHYFHPYFCFIYLLKKKTDMFLFALLL